MWSRGYKKRTFSTFFLYDLNMDVPLGYFAMWSLSLLCCIFVLTSRIKQKAGFSWKIRERKQTLDLISARLPALGTGWHDFPRVAPGCHVFPHLQLVSYFPALSTRWHVFPRVAPVVICSHAWLRWSCFPALNNQFSCFPSTGWHSFPRLVPVVMFSRD